MPSKRTRKQRKNRRRTLRRKRVGGRDSQALIPPTSAFKAPVNSTDIMGGISKL
jgi:hypothetical protein